MRWSVVLISCSVIACAIENVKGATSSAIPDLLHDCYRSNFTAISRPPLTATLLIELIRKVELDDQNAFNMRILATSMLHGVVFDGIRRSLLNGDDWGAIPFRASGEQFNKYKLVVDYLTSGESSLFPADSLTTPELCFLHTMISNTVDPWERGDESRTCVHQSSMPLNVETMSEEDRLSGCPIKKGNVKTKWGPVSAGHIIAGVASALQQSVATFDRIEDVINTEQDRNATTVSPTITANTNNVNNVWVSTIAGDLAGVILNQATETPEIGNDGFWNDTLLPRVHYLKTNKWDMTEAEILGGIDALAIASYVKNAQGTTRMRLSQLIDMYYSGRGLTLDVGYTATNRSATLKKLLAEINLEEQVAGTAKLLRGIGTYDVYLSESQINHLAQTVSEKFRLVAETITKKYDNAEYLNGKKLKSPQEIIVILDGSFDAYTTEQLLYALSEAAQVSHYGSKLGVINGQSGNWMANVTGELFQLFADLKQTADEWPATLSLGRSLETAIYYYQNKTTSDCSLGFTRPLGRSILIVASDARLTDNDLTTSQRALNSIKKSNPEINVIFATSEQNKLSLDEFTKQFHDNDYVITPPKDVLSFVQLVSDTLASIPGNIINFYCNQSQVRLEDYITPGVETIYQIRREYIERAHITTRFVNSNYGDLSVCAIADSTETEVCKDITVNGEISFDSGELCAPESACNLHFRVSLNDTKVLCAENDCRYPDQVRIDLFLGRSSGYVPAALLGQYILVLMAIFYI